MVKLRFKHFLLLTICFVFIIFAREGGATCDPTWTATTTTGAPTKRWFHSAVWTGSKMLIWGGESDWFLYYNTGAAYDPATDTWTALSTTGAPTARSGNSAVWTGSKMIVWGGANAGGSNYFNTGAAYDPVTDSWASISTTNAPTARRFHTAIWTGSKMIVWGGENSAVLNTGAAYDPATDSWTPISTLNAPALSLHTAIWTGNKMIVWGGPDNTGAIYDPAADSWTPITTTNAPPRDGIHRSAVWTGSKMIVWGGNAGGAYDPATDSWSSISNINAPIGLQGWGVMHSAVWTGDRMIIWGGFNGSVYVNTGAAYDPATDTWTSTPTLNAPSPRGKHTTVWTGKRMIIWGGFAGNLDWFNTGGVLEGY